MNKNLFTLVKRSMRSIPAIAFSSLVTVNLVMLASSSSAQEHTPDANTLLLLHFNDDLNGADAEVPTEASGVSFEEGIFGSAAYFPENNRLIYNSAANIDATTGTLEFWVKPRWNGNDGQDHYLLRYGEAGGMLFGKDGGNFWRMILNRFGEHGQSEVGTGMYIDQEWFAGEWHHSAFTWNDDSLKVYVDGVLRAREAVGFQLPQIADSVFQIGADGEGAYFDAVLDELRLSDTERSADEIFKSYWMGIQDRITITALAISPVEPIISVGGNLPLHAVATDANDNTYLVAPVAEWTSTDPGVASVSEIGVITAIRVGQTTVFATIDGVESNRITVTVIEPLDAPTGLTLTPFPTTVLLQWDPDTSGAVVGYNLYRREAGSQFGAPVRFVGPRPFYTDYNLQPGTPYFYRIASVDRYGNESLLSDEITTTTGQNPEQYAKIANLDLLVVIYTSAISPEEVVRIRNGMEVAREFYFRNSKGQLNLNLTFLAIEGDAPSTEGVTYDHIEADLRARGIHDNQYDAIHTFATNLAGCFGGFVILGNTGASFGLTCGVAFPGNDQNADYVATWVFTHEFGHVLDGVIADGSGFPDMLFNHFPWAYPLPEGIDVFDAGAHYDGMAQILRIFGHHLEYAAPWDGYFEVLDQDQDGLADADSRAVMDEARFNSSPETPDTDADNLSDFQEYLAGVYSSADPQKPDTDSDGIADGADIYPISNFSPKIPLIDSTVSIDGVLTENEKWHLQASNPYFSHIADLQLTIYANWDDAYLYFAFESNEPLKLYLGLDASGADGTHFSPVKFPSGDYTSGDQGINEKSFGDVYVDDAFLIIRYDSSRVYLKNAALAGSAVASAFANDTYTIEARIPHNLGPGRGWTYVPPEAPTIEELVFQENDVLGFDFIARALQGANGIAPDDWEWDKKWATMFELYHFYDAELTKEDIGTAVVDRPQAFPSQYALWQNYPNPFNPSTSIRYQLPAAGMVNLAIFNARGQIVRTLVHAQQAIGNYRVQWDGRDDSGAAVASGVYFYRLKVGENTVLAKQMIRIK